MLRDERGFGIVIALFMTLIVSALGASMAFVARTETLSSQSYTTMTQARYAAESGLAAASHYLLSGPFAAQAPGTAGDPLSNYDTTVSPVRRAGTGDIVQLSTELNGSSYPVANVADQFRAAGMGELPVNNGNASYESRATLLSLRLMNDTITGQPMVLQSWEVTGIGRRGGSGSAEVEVTAVIERQTVPTFRYAAFATDAGCGALDFSGGATTRSYNSAELQDGSPVIANTDGDVGTNGNLTLAGTPTQVYGTLSTPRTGVGSCSNSNVTAVTIQGKATVHEGLVELPQVVEYPAPPPPSPMPPTGNVTINNSFNCSGYTGCAKSGNVVTLSPTSGVPYLMGDVSIGPVELVLNAGTYHFNSFSAAGNARIRVAGSDPVIINIAGAGGGTSVLSIAGGVVSNTTYNPAKLQFMYSGTKSIDIAGGSETAALIYAPQADVKITGNSEFYGAIVGGQVTLPGSASLFYDTNLGGSFVSVGKPVMSSFTWRTF